MTVDLLPTGLVDDPWPEVARAGQAACDHEDVEAALAEIVRAALRVNGDAESAARPGALEGGGGEYVRTRLGCEGDLIFWVDCTAKNLGTLFHCDCSNYNCEVTRIK